MALSPLEAIRAKLKEQENRSSGTRSTLDNTIYPQWNIKEGTDSLLRLLPDGDENNTFFWVERAMINLPFEGVMGQADNKQVSVRVPCMDMYGKPDPILTEIRPWWDDPSLKPKASIYWKKRSYLFQGFVVEDGLKEENPPENPIRRFVITPQIFQIIRSALVDPELDYMPTDFVNGLDFRICKTMKGKYADYSTSKWSRRSRPLTDMELDAIEKFGLFDLSSFLPKEPTAIEQQVIKEMFEASVNGEAFDLNKWGQYYKPYGISETVAAEEAASKSAPVAKTTPAAAPAPVAKAAAPVQEAVQEEVKEELPWEEDAPVAEAPVVAPATPVGTGSDRAADILAMIRNRNTAQ